VTATLSRREFLKVSASSLGGFVLISYLPESRAENNATEPAWMRDSVNHFVRVEPDGEIVIGARCCEMGQGVKTSLPMLIAEEFDVPWSMVRVEQLSFGLNESTDGSGLTYKYGQQNTDASASIRRGWNDLRQIGAKARYLFVQAAANYWLIDSSRLETHEATVVHPDGRTLGYAELSQSAREIELPDATLPLKPVEQFKIIGQPIPTTDAKDIVTGSTKFGSDFEIPGSVFAVVARCPYFEGALLSYDASATLRVPGVLAVHEIPGPNQEDLLEGPQESHSDGLGRNLAAGVAVIAEDTWSALKGRQLLQIKWKAGPWADDSTEALKKRATEALQNEIKRVRSDGDINRARKNAAKIIESSYFVPFLAHCTMEPMHANIELRNDSALLVTSIQVPDNASKVIHLLTGIKQSNIDIRLPRSGGGFGRRIGADYVAEAVYIAQAINKPVKLIWTRDDDLQNDLYRPAGMHAMSATIDENKNVSSWTHSVAATYRLFREPGLQGLGVNEWVSCLDPDAFPAGCIDNYEASFTSLEFGLRRGWWRGPLPTFTAFATQSFIDEVAHAAKRDPLEFRLSLLGKSREMDYRDMNFEDNRSPTKIHTGRLAQVLKRVASTIAYERKLKINHGIGFAVHFVYGAYAAHAMEVSVNEGKLKIHRCVCAIDIGQIVNPLGVEAQIMSGTLDGISMAINSEITVENGKIQQNNFSTYPFLRMADAPDVEVEIVESDYPPLGAGEMGVPTAAPALTNAIYAATGKRIYQLPITDQLSI
jgi:isoquinoline 1-oxidoreductase subunit beta